MTFSELQRAALAMFAAREAGPRGSLNNMRAIAFCMRNRVKAGWHDGNWLKAIENAQEDSAHELPSEPMRLNPSNGDFQKLVYTIEEIFYAEPPGGEATDDSVDLETAIGTSKYWAFLNRPMRPWFQENIVRNPKNHPGRASAGTMMFYE